MLLSLNTQKVVQYDRTGQAGPRSSDRWVSDRAAAAGSQVEWVIATYEAGWSGCWLARWLTAKGVEVHVVQPSSVPVDRRRRRAKSDRIDAESLFRTLMAWLRGDPRVCSMVPITDEADEDARRCVRERTELISERVRLTNRIGTVLATLGVEGYNPLLQSRRHLLPVFRLRGIKVQSATVLVREFFVRHFANGKALGLCAGLMATPYNRKGGT